jgi:hypothetical protein
MPHTRERVVGWTGEDYGKGKRMFFATVEMHTEKPPYFNYTAFHEKPEYAAFSLAKLLYSMGVHFDIEFTMPNGKRRLYWAIGTGHDFRHRELKDGE